MQFVFDIREAAGAHSVHLLDATGAPITDDAGAPLVRPFELLPAAMEPTFARIVERRPGDGEMVAFGRQLFAMLIGADWWARIDRVREPIELVISCDRFPAISRLPWEMMCLPTGGFLAAEPQVGIVRRIGSATSTFTHIPSPPSVLVAVGSNIQGDVIRPGAECLALINGLRGATAIRLRTRLLLNASPRRLGTAVREFKPQVVHLICHGDVDRKTRRGVLWLADEDDARKYVAAYAETLLDALGQGGTLPPIVVLSACYSAAAQFSDIGQIALPLAHELAAKVPLVAGMSGAITDQACRLFARRFYESLLSDGEIAQASAAGRRAALTERGTDPKATVEWSMPIVCLSGGVTGTKAPIDPPAPDAVEWARLAEAFAAPTNVVFCDRVHLMDDYDLLMANADVQRAVRPEHTDLQVLAVTAQVEKERKYGLTRVLRELAAKAATDGHVPILVTWLADQYPKTREKLLEGIVAATRQTAGRFEWAGPVCANLETLLRAPGASIPQAAAQAIHDRFPPAQNHHPHDAPVLALALRLDLQELRSNLMPKLPETDRTRTRVLLLLDDVHKMDAAVFDLTASLLDVDGTRGARGDIRVILTYATDKEGRAFGDGPALDSLKAFVETNQWVANRRLGRFEKQTQEDRHAYERYLLHWTEGDVKGLALRNDYEDSQWFWEAAEEFISGVPSLLLTEGPKIIRVCQRPPFKDRILRAANDEDLLLEAEQIRR